MHIRTLRFLLLFLIALGGCRINNSSSDKAYQDGLSLLLSENYSEAIKQFDQAISIDTNSFDAYLNRGYAKESLGDVIGAKKDYLCAIRLSPSKSVVALNNLAALYAESNYIDSAFYYYKEAINADSAYAFSYNGLAHVYMVKGDYMNAIRNFQQYRHKADDFCKRLTAEGLDQKCDQVKDLYDFALFHIGVSYNHLGIRDSATLYLREAVEYNILGASDLLKAIK